MPPAPQPQRRRAAAAGGGPRLVPLLLTGPGWYALVTVVTGACAAAYAWHTPPVPDLAAQVARAHVAASGGYVWWGGWFGGLHLPTYSTISPILMSLIGVGATAGLAALLTTVLAADLLRGTRRPRAGTLAFGVSALADVLGGRVTFALGVAAAMGALVLLRRQHTWFAALAGVITCLLSPLAGFFLALVAIALVVAERSRRRAAIGVAGAICITAVALALLFPGAGKMPYPWWHMLLALLSAFAVAVVCPDRKIRIGALVVAAATVSILIVPAAVGNNVVRLTWLVAAPVVIACASLRRLPLLVVAAALTVWPALDLSGQLGDAEDASTSAAYYTPVVHALASQSRAAGQAAIGQRVEVVDPRTHWSAAYIAPQFPIARGWDRQEDRTDNALFYDGTLSTRSYQTWLGRLAVGWVAVPVDVPLDYASRPEAALIAKHPAYLRLVWSNRSWRLYRVLDARPLATGARVTHVDASSITLTAQRPGTVQLQLRWSPYLSLRTGDKTAQGCVQRRGQWTTLYLPNPGEYTVGAHFSLVGDEAACPSGPPTH